MLNYERNMLLAAYRHEHPDQLNPKELTLEAFDAGLFAKYDAEIVKQAQAESIPVNVFTRSMLMFFAVAATPKTVKTKVSHACAFYDAVRPQLALPIQPPVPNVTTQPGGAGEGSGG